MIIKEITDFIESLAPVQLQESYDNAGLIIGDKNTAINQILLCLDVTENIVDEAIDKKCQLIIAHHPLIFKGIKKINGYNSIEKIIIKAIKNNIAIYAVHTNLDNVINGVNSVLAEKLGLKNHRSLQPKKDIFRKLVFFCPVIHADRVRKVIFEAGAGQIGNYDSCSFNTEGEGSFKAMENANPFVGEPGKLHFEKEIRIETIYPFYIENKVIEALLQSHPYEEVAYDIYKLENYFLQIGSGIIGEIDETDELNFLLQVKNISNCKCIRHSELLNKKIKKVAICGGSGSFLIKDAIAAKADIFISGDIKYHDFFEAENKILIADIGHYESEQFTKDLLYTFITKKFPNFAVLISENNTNPIHYL